MVAFEPGSQEPSLIVLLINHLGDKMPISGEDGVLPTPTGEEAQEPGKVTASPPICGLSDPQVRTETLTIIR